MNESSGQNSGPTPIQDRWCNDEIAIEIPGGPSLPLQPITGERLRQLKAARALRARLDPGYLVHLQNRGIFLTPQELRDVDPPPPGDGPMLPAQPR
jgi:hypothetical protein